MSRTFSGKNPNPFICAICAGTSTLCYKCQIDKLTQEVHELREELTRLYAIKSEELKLKYHQLQDIETNIKQRNTPFNFEYESKLSNSYFCTITFDPNRFGVESQEEDRKNYILYHLLNLMNNELFTECYGSFEYHKNGIIHAHTIIITGYPNELKRSLKPLFTNNPNNRVAIQLDKAKYPQAKQYIDKESNHYFYMSRIIHNNIIASKAERCQRRLVTDEGREREVERVRHKNI